MKERGITTLAGIVITILLCFLPSIIWQIAVTWVALLCAREWNSAYHKALGDSNSSLILNGILCYLGALYPLGIGFASRSELRPEVMDALIPSLAVLVFTLLLFRAYRGQPALGDIKRFYGLVGAIYIGLLSSGLILLQKQGNPGQGAWITIFVISCVWASDIFAFVVGKQWGRTKLAFHISPGKTVEGAVGGLLGALLIGAMMGTAIHLSIQNSLLVACIAGVAGPIGDLWESALKREIGIKDFGSMVRGHGGVLDRLDSHLFVAPLCAFILCLLLK